MERDFSCNISRSQVLGYSCPHSILCYSISWQPLKLYPFVRCCFFATMDWAKGESCSVCLRQCSYYDSALCVMCNKTCHYAQPACSTSLADTGEVACISCCMQVRSEVDFICTFPSLVFSRVIHVTPVSRV